MNKPKWPRYLIVILSIVTVICVGIGTYKHVVNPIVTRFSEFGPKIDIHFGDTPVAIDEENVITDSFQNIDIHADACRVFIQEGDTTTIRYTKSDDFKPTYEVKDGTLYIDSNESEHPWSAKDHMVINFRDHEERDLVLTIAKGTKLSSVTLEGDMASFDVEDMTCEKMDADLDMASLQCNVLYADRLIVNTDMGSAEFGQATVEYCTVNADMGSVEMNGNIGRMDGDVSMGSVDVENANPNPQYNIDNKMSSLELN